MGNVNVEDYDFGGYATRNDLLCGDGRIIRKNAFINQDGQEVPLIWNHEHNDPDAVLGHAILENREDGVYAYCKFNDTPKAQNAKKSVEHGDVRSLSIWANNLKQMGSDVVHGVIRELSLVLAGANPGAYVDFVLAHGDDETDSLYANYDENAFVLFHSAEKNEKKGDDNTMEDEKKTKETDNSENETIGEIFETLSDKQKKAVYALIGQAIEDASNGKGEENSKEKKGKEVTHSSEGCKSDSKKDDDVIKHESKSNGKVEEDTSDDGDETIGEIFETLNEKQKKAVYAIIGEALAEKEDEKEDVEGGNKDMKHNVFENETGKEEFLSHSEMVEIVEDAKRNGSLAESFLAHGIEQIDYLFPDAKSMDTVPGFVKRDDTWVGEFMNAVHKTPFSRIKSVFADITEADARAKGYIKGNEKTDELFTLLKRVTTPTTVYKKQSLDRDDVVDITEFDSIAWLKGEMRMMLDEEIARAALVGDGRSPSSNDKINEQNIRPIWTDDDIYTVKVGVEVTSATTDDEKAKAFIKASIKSRKNYKGSGNPVYYMSEDMLTNCLLLEDLNGRVIYDSVDKLATTLRVRKIVAVPVMENLTRVVGSNTHTLAGIYVNPADYNIGADKGGAVNMFDDFDIDFNKEKYLIETRCSGALTKPYAAVAVEFVQPTE